MITFAFGNGILYEMWRRDWAFKNTREDTSWETAASRAWKEVMAACTKEGVGSTESGVQTDNVWVRVALCPSPCVHFLTSANWMCL